MLRTAKITAVVVLALILLLAAALVALRLYFNDVRIKGLLAAKLESVLASQIEIGSLVTSGWLEVHAADMVLTNTVDQRRWLAVDSLTMSLDPERLLYKELKIGRIDIKGIHVDYGSVPAALMKGPGGATPAFALPVKVLLDSCVIKGLMVRGPEADVIFDLDVARAHVTDLDDFGLDYKVKSRQGRIHFLSDSLQATCDVDIESSGQIALKGMTSQTLFLNLDSLRIVSGRAYNAGSMALSVRTTSDFGQRLVAVDDLEVGLNGERLLAISGSVRLKESPQIQLAAKPQSWQLEHFGRLLEDMNLPVRLSGLASLEEGKIDFSSGHLGYDLALALTDVDFNYHDTLEIKAMNGRVAVLGADSIMRALGAVKIDTLKCFTTQRNPLEIVSISFEGKGERAGSAVSMDVGLQVTKFFDGTFKMKAAWDKSHINGTIEIRDMNLERVFPADSRLGLTGVRGRLDLEGNLKGAADSVDSQLKALAKNLVITTANDSLNLGDQAMQISGETTFRDSVLNSRLSYGLGEVATGTASVRFPFKENSGDSLTIAFDANIDNSLLPQYLPPSLTAGLGPIDVSGSTEVEGHFISPVDSLDLRGESVIKVKPTDMLLQDFQILISVLTVETRMRLENGIIEAKSEASIGEVYAAAYSDIAFEKVGVEVDFHSVSDSLWRLEKLEARIPSLRSIITGSGEIGTGGKEAFSNLDLQFLLQSTDTIPLSSALSLYGGVSCDVSATQRGGLLEFAGNVKMDSFGLVSEVGFFCDNVNGSIPIGGVFNLDDSLFVSRPPISEPVLSAYRRNRTAGGNIGNVGKIKIDRILAGPVRADNTQIDIAFRDGILMVPYIEGNLLGGDFGGRLRIDLQNVNLSRQFPNWENVKYDITMETAGLDLNLLSAKFGPHESRTTFASNLAFTGRGLIAPGADYTLDGVLHITEIGPQVTDRVLDLIDPEGQNPSVGQTKGLLNMKLLGIVNVHYRPTRFTFAVEHGGAYPRLYMDQPFYADVIPLLRIPMPIEYGRIPLKAIVNNIKESAWQ